jgi:hypothetical protein
MLPNWSTTTEWSMTRSAGFRGLILFGSPPSADSASRIPARSTTAGTPVKSWSSTRATWKEISVSGVAFGFQASILSTCSRFTTRPSS